MAAEIEIKLCWTDDRPMRLARRDLPGVAGPAVRRHLVSTYFDTPDHALRQARVALRVRHVSGQWIQTCKRPRATHDGIAERDEWEWPVNGPYPRLDLLPKPPELAPLESLATRIQPIFTTDFWRSARELIHGDTRMELAVDRGAISAGDKQRAIAEIELEHLAGPVGGLRLAADHLCARLPLAVDEFSKASRGYAMIGPDHV